MALPLVQVGHTLHRDRRSNIDRRTSFRSSTFPLIDAKGKVISKDRRYNPERRLANIVLEELHMKDNVFLALFPQLGGTNLFSNETQSPCNREKPITFIV